MAHWLLRGRMAEHNEDGRARQERITDEPHRPEQNKEDQFERESRETANDVRSRGSSAK